MATIYSMRGIAESDSQYVYWTDSEPDLTGANAPEAIVADTATILSVGGTATATGGTPQLHDTTHSPVGLWQFDGDLTDSSGNGLDLTLSTGSALYTKVFDLPGMFFNGATGLSRPSRDAALAISGNMTIEFMISTPLLSGLGTVCQFGDASSETEAGNILYRVISIPDLISCGWEYGAGVDQNMTEVISTGSATLHFALVRKAGATEVRRFVNGALKTVDTSLTPPTGGTLSTVRLSVGDDSTGGLYLKPAFLSSLKIIDGALSDDDVKAEYNRTLGPLLGVI
jgi:hypothetical protein